MTARLRSEDIAVGEEFDLGCATLDEEQIIAFAREWDPQEFHVERDSRGAERFGGVIASGVQTIGLFMRMAARVYTTWEIVAGRAIRDAEFLRPVRAGVRLRGRLSVERIEHYSSTRSTVTHRGEFFDDDGIEVFRVTLEAVLLRHEAKPKGTLVTENRVAVVTGGTGGVGSHVCRLLAEQGHDVVFSYRSNTDARDALLAELGGRARAVHVDLGSPDSTRNLLEEAAAVGAVHAVVHAGGPYVPQRYVSEIDVSQFARHLDEEVLSFFALMRASLPLLRATSGSIVAVTTVAVRRFPTKDVLSAAPKASVEALIRAIAKEEGRHGVRANAVGPGILADGMATALHAEGDFGHDVQMQVLRTIPLRRFGSTRDVAEVAAFLASSRAAYVTGQVIDVDGGYQL